MIRRFCLFGRIARSNVELNQCRALCAGILLIILRHPGKGQEDVCDIHTFKVTPLSVQFTHCLATHLSAYDSLRSWRYTNLLTYLLTYMDLLTVSLHTCLASNSGPKGVSRSFHWGHDGRTEDRDGVGFWGRGSKPLFTS